jgi:hypothetical protein
MIISQSKIFWVAVFIFAGVSLLGGCSDSDAKKDDEYLIRIGDCKITRAEFDRAFEISRAAYPNHISRNPQFKKKAGYQLLKQLTDTLVIRKRASELGIGIEEQELEKEISSIKKDFSEEDFRQILLESAISYSAWKWEIKSKLLTEKVLRDDLGDEIVVSTEEIENYIKELKPATEGGKKSATISKKKKEKIRELIYRNKMEQAYPLWIRRLREKYQIEINREQWKQLIGYL